jgi:hypothetical protein
MSRRLIRRELALEKIGICASTFHKLVREARCSAGRHTAYAVRLSRWLV